MSNVKRYQNPEVFEQLAIEYAVGALHGRAKKRFEALMETHFYLQATVEAYQHKFANLVELLPDTQPSDQMWKNIEAKISSTASAEPVHMMDKTSWWQSLFNPKVYGLFASVLLVSVALIFNPMTGGPSAYTAVLESSATKTPMALTRISHSDMAVSIDMMKSPKVPDDMELTLWCQPKKGGKPIMMGTIAKKGKTVIRIDKAEWKNFKNVGFLTVSVEHPGTLKDTPSGDVILKGQLSSIHET